MSTSPSSQLLAGRVVAVTGAGNGLGLAYAVTCAEHGARVVVNDVRADDASRVVNLVRERGGQAVSCPGSVEDWQTGARVVEAARSAFGHIDGLVANAGVKHEAPPWEETEEGLRRIAEVNILGTQFCARHVLAAMVADGRSGSLVNVVSGARHGIPGMSAYGATKGAVDAMTATWALDCARVGIRVNAVSPLAMTDMAAADQRTDRPRLAPPARIAPLVVALLSERTDGVTGRVVRFDGTALSAYQPPELEALAEVQADSCDAPALADVLTRLAEGPEG